MAPDPDAGFESTTISKKSVAKPTACTYMTAR
ncbi:hypothetical protein AGROH133_06317 [Agrobacterium tumefaciens]|nr:hypothetical protein AGROH133_06317 [Agrobacterium tumefaciens]